ncbi:hypothetical protein ACFO4P_13545 [Epilithonimonas pallida]|uniref:Trypsin-like peptidase domain-containing protein n=1 Tax=Epilithonimonas pallida TaxID=373671 RepID=A0ABY1QZ08_9FLAO|nr:hypothetical protein [Epilithonimonas pallida]SMP85878.1 hypothetical protein SAMN05421679_10129 [Epilithonimonas pallida]
MANLKNLVEYHLDLQFRASQDAYNSTCHFLIIKNAIPEPHGTGVFVQIFGKHFLFTAAHVAEDLQTSISIGIDSKNALTLGGVWLINELGKNQKREDDKIDIAILELDKESIEKVTGKYSFLNENQLGINHEIVPLPYYTAIGFAATQNKFNKHKNQLRSTPFIYNTIPAEKKIYTDMTFDESLNILVKYSKKNVIDNATKAKVTGPNAYGMSGGGLWFIPTQLIADNENVDKKLVSILTEWSSKKNIWVSTRIDVFTEIIRKKYNLNIPKSNILKINI